MTVDTVTQPVDGGQLNITPLTNQVLENMFLDGENSCEKQLLTSGIRKRVSQTLLVPCRDPLFLGQCTHPTVSLSAKGSSLTWKIVFHQMGIISPER